MSNYSKNFNPIGHITLLSYQLLVELVFVYATINIISYCFPQKKKERSFCESMDNQMTREKKNTIKTIREIRQTILQLNSLNYVGKKLKVRFGRTSNNTIRFHFW